MGEEWIKLPMSSTPKESSVRNLLLRDRARVHCPRAPCLPRQPRPGGKTALPGEDRARNSTALAHYTLHIAYCPPTGWLRDWTETKALIVPRASFPLVGPTEKIG